MMDYKEEDSGGSTFTTRCDICERDVICASDTGEPILSESCGDLDCELLSSARNGGDPEPLDFSDSGC